AAPAAGAPGAAAEAGAPARRLAPAPHAAGHDAIAVVLHGGAVLALLAAVAGPHRRLDLLGGGRHPEAALHGLGIVAGHVQLRDAELAEVAHLAGVHLAV